MPATARSSDSILSSWVAVDPASVRLLEQASRIAGNNCAVLIRGDAGTGKSLLSSILHFLGRAPEEPLVVVDCFTLPLARMETELFGSGHDGSTSKGRLELAASGTIVLDEFSALSTAVQARLLQVIEEQQFQRAGTGAIRVRARVVAISSVDLEHAIAQRSVREDLYFRLNVLPLALPPLRERPADIVPLAQHFLEQLCGLHHRPPMKFSAEALSALANYEYPGNIRELKAMVDRAARHASVLNGRCESIDARQTSNTSTAGPILTAQDLFPNSRSGASSDGKQPSLADMERQRIAEVLDHTHGNKTMAAEILGISRKTLLEKRKRYGLD